MKSGVFTFFCSRGAAAVVSMASFHVAAPTARGEIVAASGKVQVVEMPDAAPDGRLKLDPRIRIFVEQRDVTLDEAITVDVSRPGTVPKRTARYGPKGKRKQKDNIDPNLSPKTIPAGTRVNSYYIHYGTDGLAPTKRIASGSITFDDKIIGIVIKAENQLATNSALGVPGLRYPGAAGGFDFMSRDKNSVTLSTDRHKLTFTMAVSTATDNIRVITSAEEVKDEFDKGKRRPLSKKGKTKSEDAADSVDLLPKDSLWTGRRTALNQSEVFNCRLVVTERRGDIAVLELTEWPAFRVQMTFREKNRRLTLLGWKYIGGRHIQIDQLKAFGSTNGQGMAIEYSWSQSSLNTNRKAYKNRLTQGLIEVARE